MLHEKVTLLMLNDYDRLKGKKGSLKK